MPIPETLAKLASFLEVTELLDADDRGVFIRVIKRMTSEDDVDTKLRDWNAIAVDAAWYKARAEDIKTTIADRRGNMQKKLFGGVEDKNTPKWQVEARLEQDPNWIEINRQLHVANQLQIVADKVCEIAILSLKSLEAQGNNIRFHGRVEGLTT